MTKPGQFNIYKKSACVQWKLMLPRTDANGNITKNGALLLEFANSLSGQDKYDWSNKLNFAFGVNDICLFFNNYENPGKFIHTQGSSTKILEFAPGSGQYEGTFMLSLAVKEDSGTKKITAPISAGEFFVLNRLLIDTLPKLIGWR